MPGAESESVRDDASTAAGGDVEMEETQDGGARETNEAEVTKGPVEDIDTGMTQNDTASDAPPGFITYLSSPIVTLITGRGGQTVLSAHQALLMKSPFFATICQSIVDDGSVSVTLQPCELAHRGWANHISVNWSQEANPLTHLANDATTAATNRAPRRRQRRRRQLPRVPVHGRILSAQSAGPALAGNAPQPARGRRLGRAPAAARAHLHVGGEVWHGAAEEAGGVQDPLHQLDGQGRDCVRAVRVRPYGPGGHVGAGADC